MTRVVILLLALLVAAPAHAGWFNFGKKSTTYQPPSSTTGFKYGSGTATTTTKVPAWKQRYLMRQEQQWEKPGGVNFPTPEVTTPGTAAPKAAPSRRVGFFARLRNAWRSRWGNRQINADKTSPLENQAGFGANVRRSTTNVAFSWRNRLDRMRLKIRQRVRPKRKPFKPPRPKAFKPAKPKRPPVRWNQPPPGW